MTVNDVFEKAMSLMDERTDTGAVDGDTTLIYKLNAPYILNMLQNELLTMGDFYSTYEISRSSITPLLGKFNVEQHKSEDENEVASGVAYAYYLEVDGPGTVYIEDRVGSTWNVLETLTIPNTVESFTAYKGLITPSVGADTTRIRFSGDYFYNYRNIALYEENFGSEDRIPEYSRYISFVMPDDFSSTSQLVKEDTDYGRLTDYKWEGQKNLFIPYSFDGNVRIVYRPIPTALSDSDSTIAIDDVVASAILPYGLARELLATENTTLSNYFGQRYEELKYTLIKPRPTGTINRNDEYDASLGY